MTKKTIKTTETIYYKGQEIEIDLKKKAPLELLEIKTKPMSDTPIKRKTPTGNWEVVRYLPSFILRQIFIKMGFKKEVITTDLVSAPEDGKVFNISIKVITPEGDILYGYSGEYIGKGKITKASLGALKAIESRAIKDALRWKYPFFTMDGDFTEDEIEKSDYQDSTTASLEDKKEGGNKKQSKLGISEAFESLGKALEVEEDDIKKLEKQFKGKDFLQVYNKLKPILEKGTVNNKPISNSKHKLMLIENIKKLYDTDLLLN